MHKLFNFCFLLIFSLLLVSAPTSCTKNEEEPFLSVSTNALNTDKKETTLHFIIESNVKWIISDNAEWISLSTLEGAGTGTISVYVSANTGFTERTGEVKIVVDGVKKEVITVTQLGDSPAIAVNADNYNFPVEGGNFDLGITANCPWEISSNADWFTLSQNSGEGNAKVTITAQPTQLTEIRTAEIKVKETVNNTEKTVTISQDKLSVILNFEFDTKSVSYLGGAVSIAIKSNTDWQISTKDSWCTLSPTSGSGDATVTATLEANTGAERTATIILSDKLTGTEKEIKIVQNKLLCRLSDSLALVDFYNATNGDSWKKDKWDLTQPMTTWKGIRLNAAGRVDSLHLATSVIPSGSIPASIGDLDNLRKVSLAGNNLSGNIPDEFFTLPLRYLALNSNANLVGDITTVIKSFPELTYLTLLGDTKMTGTIPVEIGKLDKIQTLFLSNSGLSGDIPEELKGCKSLVNFGVYGTNITSIPDIFDQLPNIGIIQVHKCAKLEQPLPKSWGKVVTTAKNYAIQAFECNFTGSIPQEWESLPANTNMLQIYGNKLTGKVPQALQDHPNWSKWNAADKILPQQEGYGLTL